ncbi:helix-turn-helix domain-containing protein [Nocardiopsis trehalosi]|jgi:excisionase family DNA binding protein|uniref:helix-turn-helix domain-containing protein n=1 Tax=Nocardiopsis trehalosi TaxID=109329 RepID=UPI00082F272C|nr:helix-turn-helix domain-containing protein [Nocardiopsis trehalosi]
MEPSSLYSVEQVAERLGLHVRTVRKYVRDGRLKAVKVGRRYRITREDVEAFTGLPLPPTARESAVRHRRVEVSSIVGIDAVDPETARRVVALLTAAAAGRGADGPPLRVETAYDEERAHMKVIVLGGPAETARLLEYVNAVVEP